MGLTDGFVFFLGKIGQENVFYGIVERNNAFLGYKNMNFQKSKNWDLSKEVSPWFGSKIGNFSIFLFCEKYSMKIFLRIV